MAEAHLFVGDSITVGLAGSSKGIASDVALTKGSGYRLIPQAALKFDPVGPFVDENGAHHGAIGGATTITFDQDHVHFVNGPKGLTWMEQFQPDTVSIALGTNDLISFRSDNVSHVIDRIGILVTSANALVPAARYELCSIPECGPDWFTDKARQFNGLLQARVNDPKHFKGPLTGKVEFIDLSKKINAAFAKEGLTNVTSDGTHPNARGYRLMGDAYVEARLTGGVTDEDLAHPGGGLVPSVPAKASSGGWTRAGIAVVLGALAASQAPKILRLIGR